MIPFYALTLSHLVQPSARLVVSCGACRLDKLNGTLLRQGIGRECVRLVADFTCMNIIAAANNGHTSDDGSHLTGDAPRFVAFLRKQGLLG